MRFMQISLKMEKKHKTKQNKYLMNDKLRCKIDL